MVFEVVRRESGGDWSARSDDGGYFLVSERPILPRKYTPTGHAMRPSDRRDSAASADADLRPEPVENGGVSLTAGPAVESADVLDDESPAIRTTKRTSMVLALDQQGHDDVVGPIIEPTEGISGETTAEVDLHPIPADGDGIRLDDLARTLCSTGHPSMPPRAFAGRDPEGASDVLILEYDPRAEWLPAVEIGTDDMCRLGGQIAQAFDAIHQAGYCVVSLRPDAVRWSREASRASIARFDGVTPIGGPAGARSWGVWTAPEVGQGADAAVSADVYSLGMILADASGSAGTSDDPEAGRFRDAIRHRFRTSHQSSCGVLRLTRQSDRASSIGSRIGPDAVSAED